MGSSHLGEQRVDPQGEQDLGWAKCTHPDSPRLKPLCRALGHRAASLSPLIYSSIHLADTEVASAPKGAMHREMNGMTGAWELHTWLRGQTHTKGLNHQVRLASSTSMCVVHRHPRNFATIHPWLPPLKKNIIINKTM